MKIRFELLIGITLLIISVFGTIVHSEITEGIICVSIIPTFILSITSFFSELSVKCQKNAIKGKELTSRICNSAQWIYNQKSTLSESKDETDENVEFRYKDKFELEKDINQYANDNLVYSDMTKFFLKAVKVLKILSCLSYIALFVSLILSQYFYQWLININLNCLALWSLTILYITVELKSYVIAHSYGLIQKIYERKYK